MMTLPELPPVVAYGYENTRPTERAALMMVKLSNASDQYPELATPLVRKDDAIAYAQQAAALAVQAERERAELDAKRYRWLRDHAGTIEAAGKFHWDAPNGDEIGNKGDAESLDAAVDAAIRNQPEVET